MESISARQARRIALHAQGLVDARPDAVGGARVRKLSQQLGAIQIDSVNVVARAHYLPLFARLGDYDTGLLDREAWGKKQSLFEYWAHALCFMPVEMQPLFRWRMEAYRKPDYWMNPHGELKDAIARVKAQLMDAGPLVGGDVSDGEKRVAGWWNWSPGKRALEYLFRVGEVSIATRKGFERVYDLTERVIPSAILNTPTPTEDAAIDGLVAVAVRALGIGTEGDIRDYFRIYQKQCKASLARLEEAGVVERVRVEGWNETGWMAVGAKAPRRGAAGALLSPFDNMIWHRDRAERLFGVKFKIEIYTPADQRTHGYYVLFFVRGDAIAARVDLKSDRKAGVLRVQAAHLEPGADEGETAPALAAELTAMAGWLGLGGVAVTKKGDLAAALGRFFD